MSKSDKHEGLWQSGDLLLDEFEVLKILGRGGMGEVFLVRRLCTGDLFAVKTSRHSETRDDHREHLFLNELRVWLELPLHPHLCACNFFRTIDDRTAIFGEYVDGQSLREWIDNENQRSVTTILDIAIQFAWGLHAAHTQSVVHQDVKPANVLLTGDGCAKVTDFGLARAREIRGITTLSDPGSDSSFPWNQGMTLAYCSPEQALRKKLTYKTDIWSYGLSVLHMFLGHLTWNVGALADDLLEMVCQDPLSPDIPPDVAAVLCRCFKKNPKDRWESMDVIADELQKVYEKLTQQVYERVKPEYPEKKVNDIKEYDRLTVSGRSWDDPRSWLKTAFELAEFDPEEIELIIPKRTGSRTSQAIVDLVVYNKAINLFREMAFQGKDIARVSLGLIFRNTALIQRSLEDLPGAIRSLESGIETWEELVARTPADGYQRDLAKTHMQKATLLAARRDFRLAVESVDKALEYFQALPREKRHYKDSKSLAEAYQTKADALWNLAETHEAVALYDKTIDLLKELSADDSLKIQNDVAKALANKGNALLGQGKHHDAIAVYTEAIHIQEHLVASGSRKTDNAKVQMDLAKTYFNISVALKRVGDHQQRLTFCDMAVSITDRLVTEERRREYIDFLSTFYVSKAGALINNGRKTDAVETYNLAINILENQFYHRGRNERATELAMAYTNKANILSDSVDSKQIALELYDRSLMILDHVIKTKPRSNLKPVVSDILMNKGDTLREIGALDRAIDTLDRALGILWTEIKEKNRVALMADVGWVKVCKTKVYRDLKVYPEAIREGQEASRILMNEIEQSGRVDLKDIHEEVQDIISELENR